MKMILGYPLVLLLLAGVAQAGAANPPLSECQHFIGNWQALLTNDSVPDYTNVSIQYPSDSTTDLIVTFNKGDSDQFSESLIIDGAVHKGDQFSGDTYTAVCEGNQFKLVQKFSDIIKPVDTVFTLNGDYLNYRSVVEGDRHPNLEDFIRE